MSDNFASITGNVASDPELTFTQKGTARLIFRVAHNTRKRNDDGTWEDGEPSFFSIVVWGTLAENTAETITKGTRVTVTGALRSRSWEADDGTKRYAVEIVASDVSPSLRWATAAVTKAASSGGGGGAPADYTPPPDDEEPF